MRGLLSVGAGQVKQERRSESTIPLAMPIPVEALREAGQSLHQRILTFLESRPGEAFSLLEIIEAVEPMPAHQVVLVAAAQRAKGIASLLDRYENALHDLEHDTGSGCPVFSAERGGVRYFGLTEAWRAKERR